MGMGDWYRKRQPTRTRIVFTHPMINTRDGTQEGHTQYSALRQQTRALACAKWASMTQTEDLNTGVIPPEDVPYQLCDVDPSPLNFCAMGRAPLWCMLAPDAAPSGTSKPYGKGVSPLHCPWIHWPVMQMSMPGVRNAEDRLYGTAYAGRTAESHRTCPALWGQYGSGADPAPRLGARPWHDGPV